jgi:hypothetical protein
MAFFPQANLGNRLPEFVEINSTQSVSFMFSGIPWNLDWRLSHRLHRRDGDGTVDCEPTSLLTFLRGSDPEPKPIHQQVRTMIGILRTTLTSARNRILSFVTELSPGVFNFDGDNTLLAWPPTDPGAPVANDDPATTAEDTPVVIAILANDTHPNGALDPATVRFTGLPAHGTATLNTGTGEITYTPSFNFFGTDTLTYVVADNVGSFSNVATVTVTVTPVNDPPIAFDDGPMNRRFACDRLPLVNDFDTETLNPAS